jgi:PhnB protein
MNTVSPYLIVSSAAEAIDFYTRAFGAEELYRLDDPNGRVGHAELRFGDTIVMLADEFPDFGALAPARFGGSPVRLHLSVSDADAALQKAVSEGATLVRPASDEFHGDRSGMVVDPYGHSWFVSAKIADVPVEEMQRRYTAMLGGLSC